MNRYPLNGQPTRYSSRQTARRTALRYRHVWSGPSDPLESSKYLESAVKPETSATTSTHSMGVAWAVVGTGLPSCTRFCQRRHRRPTDGTTSKPITIGQWHSLGSHRTKQWKQRGRHTKHRQIKNTSNQKGNTRLQNDTTPASLMSGSTG